MQFRCGTEYQFHVPFASRHFAHISCYFCLLVKCTIPSTQATCLKNEKLRISKSIVAAMREVGGRFLERLDGGTSMTIDEKDEDGNPVAYRDIGDRRAVEKTSQG